MNDGDAHPDAEAELVAAAGLGADYALAVGGLLRTRREALNAGRLDDAFEPHLLPVLQITCYVTNHVAGIVGIVSAFIIRDNALILLAVVAFPNLFRESITASALIEALQRTDDRAA